MKDSKPLWLKAREDATHLAQALPDLTAFPRDAVAFAEATGCEVTFARLSRGLKAVVLKRRKGSDPEIYVDSFLSAPRRRFMVAHCLGHVFQRATTPYGARYSFECTSAYNIHEFYADEFAGGLLMPPDEVSRLQDGGWSTPVMAIHFGVSTDDMAERLRRLEIAARQEAASE